MKSQADVKKLMAEIFNACMITREDGQKEYAHNEANALQNFDDEAKNLDIPRMKVWAVFAGKHWRGIRAYINGHKSQREDVRGRIKDLIVYLVLLEAMIYDDEAKATPLSPGEESLRKQRKENLILQDVGLQNSNISHNMGQQG